jgi:hypothetical protein
MTEQEKEKLNKIGSELSAGLAGFFGKVSFNIHNGTYVNANVEESIKPEKDK